MHCILWMQSFLCFVLYAFYSMQAHYVYINICIVQICIFFMPLILLISFELTLKLIAFRQKSDDWATNTGHLFPRWLRNISCLQDRVTKWHYFPSWPSTHPPRHPALWITNLSMLRSYSNFKFQLTKYYKFEMMKSIKCLLMWSWHLMGVKNYMFIPP